MTTNVQEVISFKII